MKTFKDLEFKKHSNSPHFGTQAIIEFENGYGASVITGDSAYSNAENPYELAVVYFDEDGHHLTYDTSITDDVMGYLTEKDVTDILIKIQQL